MDRAWIVRGVVAAVAALLGVVVGLLLVGFDVLPGTGTVLGADAGDEVEAAAPSTDPVPSCDDERVDVRIAAAPEIAPALEEIAAQAGEGDAALECVVIDVAAIAPSQVSASLARGWTESADGPPPQVWVPTTSTEVELARGELGDLLPDELPSLARSPMVIGMPRPMADALGWPDGDLDWEGVTQLASADDAWANRDHADWDPFRLSLVSGVDAEPTITAVTSIAGAVGALPGPETQDQSDEERFQSQAQLLLVERRVEYLGSTTAEQLDELWAADTDDELAQTTSAVPLTEQQVWQFNGGASGTAPDTPLAAWYPDDGGADADYPYVQLDAPWATAETASATEAFLAVLQSEDGLERLRARGFRDGSREATPELIEADNIRPELAGPAPDRPLALVSGAVAQAWRGLSQTGNLLGVIDVSGSMKTEVAGTDASRLDLSKEGLSAGVQLLDPASHGGLWEFSTDLGGGRDWRELIPMGPLSEEIDGMTRQEAEIAAIRRLRPRADTGLYDTILASYRHLLDNYEDGKLNAVIFFTDGKNDDADGISLQQLQRQLRELVDPDREALFIGVGYGPEADFEALSAVTQITGGKLYDLDRPEDIRDVFIDVQTGNVR
jgi:Ca-activated chloride channel family protein